MSRDEDTPEADAAFIAHAPTGGAFSQGGTQEMIVFGHRWPASTESTKSISDVDITEGSLLALLRDNADDVRRVALNHGFIAVRVFGPPRSVSGRGRLKD